ncbi:hypothetical protein M758_5G010700 [Ceratodon purpureus]|nr:hypothetical protein M758_5G010700 [Ceratodon purpureus]
MNFDILLRGQLLYYFLWNVFSLFQHLCGFLNTFPHQWFQLWI